MRSRGVASVAVAALAAAAQGQPTSAIRAELRLVSQIGTPPNQVLSFDGDVHADTSSPVAATRRFEVQYRLVDLDTADAIVPAGLSSAQLVINATGGLLQRALLTGHESGSLAGGGSLPPVSQSVNLDPDFSGAAANSAAGTHRPFRGGIPAPAPNNNNPANGVFENGNTRISAISLLSLMRNDQNDGGWYGLYSFTFAGNEPTGAVTAAFVTDATTNGRVGFFDVNNASGGTTVLATTDTVRVVPSPTGAGMLVIGFVVLGRRRRVKFGLG